MNNLDRLDRHNLSAWTLRHQPLVIFLLTLMTLFGVMSYSHLSQSEDPPFTFKVMVVRTLWPGATATQVQQEVSDRIARKLQETPAVDFLRSYSRPGESTLFFTIKDSAPASSVQSTWYQVRKKVGDIGHTLPPGVQGPFFNDEFGDVYTNIYALSGDGYSPAERHEYAEGLRAELLRVPGVAKVDFFGDPEQKIYIEISNAQLSQLGIGPSDIAQQINGQNAVESAGVVNTPDDRVQIRPSGQYASVAALADTLIRANGKTFRLGDIAQVKRGYADPPVDAMRFAGHPALGIGVTMQPGGDVIELGKLLAQRTSALAANLPAGLTLDTVSNMPDAVSRSVNEFARSVAEAVVIVLIVSLVSLGLRTGMVVVISIPLVLAATAFGMRMFDIGLHKVSLGTLVLALGLLVDDAIIAVEMMAVKLEQGWDRTRAAAFAYTSTAFPMLTGTLVTVAGFLPIALAKSGTGEYTRSIFEVSAIALLLSWLSAVIVVPLLGYHLLRPKHRTPSENDIDADANVDTTRYDDHDHVEHAVYRTPFYRRLSTAIAWCVQRKAIVLLTTVVLFIVALAAFQLVPQQFFPSSDRPELMIDLKLPEGASYAATLAQTEKMETILKGQPGIARSVAFVGAGAPRFFLSLDQQLAQPNFAQFVVTTTSVAARERLASDLQTILLRDFGSLRTRLTRLETGPPTGFPVQFRVSGNDIRTVRAYADQVAAQVSADPRTRNVQLDWDEPSRRSVRFDVDQAKARALGVSSKDIADFLAMTLSSYTVTQFREQDKLISVDMRAPQADRIDPAQIAQLSMPTPAGLVPLSTLGNFRYGLEYAVIWERDRQPTITVQADVRAGIQGIDVTNDLESKLHALRSKLPTGYRIAVGGVIEENAKAQASIAAQMPVLAVVVLILLMVQLQSLSRVVIVILTAPLGLIGVVGALLLFHQPFGFVALLGVIAMFGIIMRNSVILVDQIERDIAAGHARFDAIVGATVRRFRPITLTAAAAVLALIPLLRNDFFSPMATALMGGITIATILTLFFLPALYAAFFRVRRNETPAGDRT